MLKVVNIVQDFNTGGIQKLLLEYMRYFKGNPEVQYTVLVLENNRRSAFDVMASDEDLNIVYLNCRRSKSKNYYINKYATKLSYNGRLYLWLIKNRPDIVHTHNTRILRVIRHCILACINKYVWFHTLHSDPYAVADVHVGTAYEMLEKRGMNAICLNDTQFQKARERYGLTKCDILYNVADFSRFENCDCDRDEIRKDFNIPPDAYTVGSVGRLDPVKNYGFLIEVFAEVLKQKPNSVLIIVGDGDKEALEEKAQALGVADKTYFLGFMTDTEKAYRAMDVFVSTSLTEAMSLVTLEAQATGLSCVVAASVPAEAICTDLVVRMEKDATILEWAGEIAEPVSFAKCVSSFDDYRIENVSKKMLELYRSRLGDKK